MSQNFYQENQNFCNIYQIYQIFSLVSALWPFRISNVSEGSSTNTVSVQEKWQIRFKKQLTNRWSDLSTFSPSSSPTMCVVWGHWVFAWSALTTHSFFSSSIITMFHLYFVFFFKYRNLNGNTSTAPGHVVDHDAHHGLSLHMSWNVWNWSVVWNSEWAVTDSLISVGIE